MSIEYEPIPPVPTQTNRVAKAAFPKGNIYLTLRDELGPIFSDLDESRIVLQDGKTCGATLAVGIGYTDAIQAKTSPTDKPQTQCARGLIGNTCWD
jgi:transposase